MTIRKIAFGSAAAVALAGFLSAAPAFAHTSQPATPEEIQQTDALNAQALANARLGTQPNQPTAGANVQTNTDVTPPADTSATPETTTPSSPEPG